MGTNNYATSGAAYRPALGAHEIINVVRRLNPLPTIYSGAHRPVEQASYRIREESTGISYGRTKIGEIGAYGDGGSGGSGSVFGSGSMTPISG